MRALVLAAVEFDDEAVLWPEAGDLPGAELLVSEWQRDVVFDQQAAELALQFALDRAVAWGVGIEGCPEVGGAWVAASECAVDVGRSGVVVKLGLGEGA